MFRTATLDDARARVTPMVESAVERLTPYVENAYDTARHRLRDDVLPAVTAAVENARDSSAPTRAEARERAELALLALRGERRKVRRWPAALLGLLAGLAAGVAASSLSRRTPPVGAAPFPESSLRPGSPSGEESSTTPYPAGRPGAGPA